MSRHLNASATQIAPLVLIAGDPLRTEYMAKKFLTNPQLVSKVRNNYCFTGQYKGQTVTFATSGMGIGSIAIYAHELFHDYHVQAIIRVGTCGAYSQQLIIRDLLLVEQAWSRFLFWSHAGQTNHFLPADHRLNAIIQQTAVRLKQTLKTGNILTTNVFYDQNHAQIQLSQNHNLSAVDMEAYALFALGKKFNRATATILTVSDLLYPTKESQETTFADRAFTFDQMYLLGLESLLVFARKLHLKD